MAYETTPEADARRRLMLGLSETEFAQWTHSPITRAFLQYLDDQVENWLEQAMAVFLAGNFVPGAARQDQNPEVVRGRILAVQELRRINIADIQGFYEAQQTPEDSQDDQT